MHYGRDELDTLEARIKSLFYSFVKIGCWILMLCDDL